MNVRSIPCRSFFKAPRQLELTWYFRPGLDCPGSTVSPPSSPTEKKIHYWPEPLGAPAGNVSPCPMVTISLHEASGAINVFSQRVCSPSKSFGPCILRTTTSTPRAGLPTHTCITPPSPRPLLLPSSVDAPTSCSVARFMTVVVVSIRPAPRMADLQVGVEAEIGGWNEQPSQHERYFVQYVTFCVSGKGVRVAHLCEGRAENTLRWYNNNKNYI